jgi:hypothetical protein
MSILQRLTVVEHKSCTQDCNSSARERHEAMDVEEDCYSHVLSQQARGIAASVGDCHLLDAAVPFNASWRGQCRVRRPWSRRRNIDALCPCALRRGRVCRRSRESAPEQASRGSPGGNAEQGTVQRDVGSRVCSKMAGEHD